MDAHGRFAEMVPAYVIGALNSDERAEFEAHLATCSSCTAELRTFAPVAIALAQLAPDAEPSENARNQVLAAIRPVEAPSKPIPARNRMQIAFSVFRGLHAYQVQLTANHAHSQAELTSSVLEAPDVVEIVLEGEPTVAPQASGIAFVSRARGVVLVATDVPPLPAAHTYQIWALAADTRPVSVGVAKPDASGHLAVTLRPHPQMPNLTAIAVTVEREQGARVPTGPAYLIGTTE